MSIDHDPIKWLARRCAGRGLGMQDARTLFEALYIADALAVAGGNVTRAAEIAGVNRATIVRHRRSGEKTESLRSRSASLSDLPRGNARPDCTE